MSDVIEFPTHDANSIVARVSVQISEYSEANGGRDPGDRTLYAVEVLFTDGTWSTVDFYNDYSEARRIALGEAEARGADLLEESLWPTRKVTL